MSGRNKMPSYVPTPVLALRGSQARRLFSLRPRPTMVIGGGPGVRPLQRPRPRPRPRPSVAPVTRTSHAPILSISPRVANATLSTLVRKKNSNVLKLALSTDYNSAATQLATAMPWGELDLTLDETKIARGMHSLLRQSALIRTARQGRAWLNRVRVFFVKQHANVKPVFDASLNFASKAVKNQVNSVVARGRTFVPTSIQNLQNLPNRLQREFNVVKGEINTAKSMYNNVVGSAKGIYTKGPEMIAAIKQHTPQASMALAAIGFKQKHILWIVTVALILVMFVLYYILREKTRRVQRSRRILRR